MTDVIQDPVNDSIDRASAAAGEHSLAERVRARARQLDRGNLRLPVDVPGYDGDLVAFFRKVPFAELKVIGEKIDRERNRDQEIELNAACDVLLRTVDDVMLRDPSSPTGFSRLADDQLGLGSDLAEALGLGSFPDGRSALKRIMGAGGDAGILGMFDEVISWTRGKAVEAREQIVGESSATRT